MLSVGGWGHELSFYQCIQMDAVIKIWRNTDSFNESYNCCIDTEINQGSSVQLCIGCARKMTQIVFVRTDVKFPPNLIFFGI